MFPQKEEKFTVKKWKQKNAHMFLETMKGTAANLEVRPPSIKQIWFRRFSEQVIKEKKEILLLPLSK